MILVPIVLMVLGFAGGLYLASRFAPPLADTRTGRVSSSVVDLLAGLAIAVLLLDLFNAVRAITNGVFDGWDAADALARELSGAFWSAGTLIALAAAVHLLAPPPDEDEAEIRG